MIKEINNVNKKFRVLALSATPGKTQDVIEIIQNLLIAKIEVRTEKSLDVKNYTFSKEIQVEIVKLGELEVIRDRYLKLTDPYLKKLLDFKAISSNNFNKGWIIIQQKNFAATSHPQKGEVMKIFSIAVSLLYSLDLLERHGIQIFLASFKDENNSTNLKYFVAQDRDLKWLLEEMNEKYSDCNPLALNINPLPNGDVPSIGNKELNYGHPKFKILKTKIQEFFNNGGTKTIIFCEFRDTVQLVFTMLLELRPQILPRMLIGQGGAVSQKDQLTVMKDFRSNKVNVLVTTSVCEEGIDVGEVDLVICFDINSKNPTRFVQRIGRTGRKRNGKVIILATEGKEEDVVRDVMGSKERLNKSIHTNKEISKSLYRNSPRLIPLSFLPKCVETLFNIPDQIEDKKEAKKKVVGKKGKKDAAAGSSKVTNHFKPISRSLSDEILNNNNESINLETSQTDFPVPVFPNFAQFDLSLVQIKQDFKDEVRNILAKITEDDIKFQFLKLRSKQELQLMENLMNLFHEPAEIEEKQLELKVDTEMLLENSVEIPQNNSESQNACEVHSRYGNQFTIPEPFNTPFKHSKFQPLNQLMNSTMKVSPSPVAKRSMKMKNSMENSPLLKAFENQRNMSTSTPNAGKYSKLFDVSPLNI